MRRSYPTLVTFSTTTRPQVSLLLVGTLLCVLGFVPQLPSQATQGEPPFSATDPHPYDDVNIMANGIVLHLPILHKNGAFPFDMSVSANSSMQASNHGQGTTMYWDPTMAPVMVAIGANQSLSDFTRTVNGVNLEGGAASVYPTQVTTTSCHFVSQTAYSGFVVKTRDGTIHPINPNLSIDVPGGTGCNNSIATTTIDGSGWTVQITAGTSGWNLVSLWTRDGMMLSSLSGNPLIEDRNANRISASLPNNGVVTYTDAMGQTALTFTPTVSGATLIPPFTFKWADVSQGVTTPTVTQSFYQLTLQTAFGCTNTGHLTDLPATASQYVPQTFVLADGKTISFDYESQVANTKTGRISKVTTPEGEVITYAYSGGNSGIDCVYQTPPTVTRTINGSDVTTYNLAYSQLGTSADYRAINTVTDPGGNVTKYQFTGFTATGKSTANTQVLTQVTHYQGASTLLSTDKYCYNQFSGPPPLTAIGKCLSSITTLQDSTVQVVAQPITNRIILTQYPGNSGWKAHETHYDNYGNVTYSANYDFGSTSPATETFTTYGTWTGTACQYWGNNPTLIADTPCEVISNVAGVKISDARYTYDANGNVLTSSFLRDASGNTDWVGQTTQNVYNSGRPTKVYDMNNNETDYTYSVSGEGYQQCTGCTNNYPFPIKVTNTGTGNYTSYTYYGQGGALSTSSDRNGITTATYAYTDRSGHNDPYWRPLQITNALGAVTDTGYPSGSNPRVGSSWTNVGLNGGNSIVGGISTVDSRGRIIDYQVPQSPGGSNYDTISTAYSWNGNLKHITKNTVPCSTTLSSVCSMPYTEDRDPLGRLIAASHGAGYETRNNTYTATNNAVDTLLQITPASPGENAKQKVKEYDGLGRILRDCQISSGSGTTACGVQSAGYNGILTKYQYGAVNPTGGPNQSYTNADRNDGTHDQNVYSAYDGLGRLVDVQPSYGPLLLYYFDKDGGNCPGSVSNAGRLVCFKDGINQTNYFYDSEGRLTDTASGPIGAAATLCRRFRYDNSAGVLGSLPTGVTLSNQYGRRVEVETDDCTTPLTSAHQVTDEWFGYDAMGNAKDIWQKSPHSTQYYHSVGTFYENGSVKTVQLASPAAYTMSFGMDGAGRLNSTTDTTHNKTFASGATFFPASNPATTTVFGTDSDAFTYNTTTGRMSQYQFTVNGTNYTGALSWNPNGTLRKLVTTDGFNAGGTQTCLFNPSDAANTGYDDFGRLIGFDCGSGNWGQTFGFDYFDNLTKGVLSGRTGTSWNPGYNLANNHYMIGSYDANGDVKSDGNHTYGWNEVGKLAWAAVSGTPTCGTSGRCITYDAAGRIVETSVNATWTARWYTQAGWVSMSSGTTIGFASWPAPHGAVAYEGGNGGNFSFLHPDWLGSKRLSSSPSHTITGDLAFSPYGETMLSLNNPGTSKVDFTGLTQNYFPGVMWDADARELSVVSNRWLSMDPARSGWNQYAYPTDPNSATDPSGAKTLMGLYGLANYGGAASFYISYASLNNFMSQVAASEYGFDSWINSTFFSGSGSRQSSSESENRAPQLCFCSADLTSGALAPSASTISNIAASIQNGPLPTFNDCSECQVGCTGPQIPCEVVASPAGMQFGPAPGSPGYTLSGALVNLEVIDNNGDPVYTNIQLTEIPSSPQDAGERSWGGWVGTDLLGAGYPSGASPNAHSFQQIMYTATMINGAPYVISTVMNQSWSMVNGVVTTASMLPGAYNESVWEGTDP